ncbi:xanthine dehydrogenase subunit XdhB [Pelagibaculum spongiae]|uniref:Xanthine dehydrogenase FAD-binding subunit XdhB n=1 Tax=Pelagibaculum spongiae TaxID=2080658 RepID=A0A2V1H3A0_9GAMM|nr:xanthine dehydrogenase subunit XdhB [Pelagibaculum spongiae]PVZ71698.1 xanthine dehydrogenase FAD-binding subunit XdhB [Pelagibaculum spongiae]
MFDLNTYHRASSAQDAAVLLEQYPDCKILAGGTDVLIKLREGDKCFANLVDISRLPDLSDIKMRDDGSIEIGACVTCSQVINHPLVQQYIPVLAEGAGSLGGPQVRNAATIGGNLCNGAPSADNSSPLLVLNAQVELLSAEGKRTMPLEEFYLGPGKVALNPGELMAHIVIPVDGYQNMGGHFIKYAMRGAMDIATIGCSVACRLEGGSAGNKLADFRIAYTVSAPTPKRCRNAELAMVGQSIADAASIDRLLEKLSQMVLDDLNPRDSWRAGKEFRQHIIRTLSRKVSKQAIERAQSAFLVGAISGGTV